MVAVGLHVVVPGRRVVVSPTRGFRCGIAEPSGKPAPMGQKTKYKDGFFEKVFMTLFARKMEKFAAPVKKSDGTAKKGWTEYNYESFVDVSKRVMQGRSRNQQQEVVREVLLSMLPPGAPEQVPQVLQPSASPFLVRIWLETTAETV